MALEPALRLERLLYQKLLTDDALRIHSKTILVAHAGDDEGDLELRWLAARCGVQLEGVESIKGLARLQSGRFQHHATHVLQGLDEVGLAAGIGIGAVYHRAF